MWYGNVKATQELAAPFVLACMQRSVDAKGGTPMVAAAADRACQ